MAEESSPSPKHLGYLDGLRALTALFVFVHHAFLISHLDKAASPKPWGSALSGLVFGRHAVDVFIVLSGFCLMLPIVRGDGTLRNGAWHFFKRRAWRILPPYYLAMGFSLLLIYGVLHAKTGTIWDLSLSITPHNILTHLLLFHDAFGNEYGINPVFWSIAVEWRIYFLFPFLVLAWRRIGPLPTTFFTIALSWALNYLLNHLIGSSLTIYYTGLFALGMLGATLAFALPFLRFARNLPWGGFAACLTLVVAGLSYCSTYALLPLPKTVSLIVVDYSVGLWAMCLLVAASRTDQNAITKILSYPPLVFLGTFAYSIYLVHLPLLQILWQYIFVPLQARPSLMFAALSLVGMPLILGGCYLFFLACERPFISRGKPKAVPLSVQTALEPAP